MSIENARPFDPNNRPLKGEWIHVSTDSETATMPALDQDVDASLTQGHDVVVRQPQAKKFPVALTVIAVVMFIGILAYALTQGFSDSSKDSPDSSNVSSNTSEPNSEDPQSSVSDAQTDKGQIDKTESDLPKNESEKESNPSGSQSSN